MNEIVKIMLFILILIWCLSGCGEKEGSDCHKHITIINSSDLDIYCDTSPDSIRFGYAASAMVDNSYVYKINSHDKKDFTWIKNGKSVCVEYDFTIGTVHPPDSKFAPMDSLRIFVFDAYVMEQELVYKILKRYDLSLDDLQELDWIIPYPPTEAMKEMKMHPPYGKD